MDIIALTHQSVRSMADQHLGILGIHAHRAGNIYRQDRIYPLIKSKHSLENVTRLITKNFSLVDNSYQYVWLS